MAGAAPSGTVRLSQGQKRIGDLVRGSPLWQAGGVNWKHQAGGLAGLILAASAFTSLASITTNPWEPIFRGIEFTTGTADTNELRQQKIFALRMDLAEPTLEFFSTPSNGDTPLETFGQTTTAFVQTYGVAVAVNANFFSPVNTTPNDPRELDGLAMCEGKLVSPHSAGREVLMITRSNAATIAASAPADDSRIWTAVAGSDLILVNGAVQLTNCSTSFCGPNPRTAVGISQDGRHLFMLVIDGRQTGWSDGATLAETGAWLLRLGAWNGLNLDGGGSSAMAKLTDGAAVLLNRPSGGTQRVNGNHLGVFAQPLPWIILDNTNSRVTFSGTWSTGTIATNGFGADYRWASTAAAESRTATYRPYVPAAALYDVSVWYPEGGNRATNAAWLVCFDGGTTNVIVNQQSGGGDWQQIVAAVPFAAGTNGFVRLSNDTGYSGKVVIADAVRFSYVGPLPAPTLSSAVANDMLTLWWPANRTEFRLQSATNRLGLWPGVNWSDLAGVTNNTLTLPLSRSNPAVFFRLISP